MPGGAEREYALLRPALFLISPRTTECRIEVPLVVGLLERIGILVLCIKIGCVLFGLAYEAANPTLWG
jgi:hypothetical protein